MPHSGGNGLGFVMEIRVLLIVQDEKSRELYLQAIQQEGIRVYVSPSFTDLSEEICSQTFHGIFLDFATKMKALRRNKGYIYGLLEKFPVCQLKIIEEETGRVKCFYPTGGDISHPLDFIQNECCRFIPSPVRTEPRMAVHLNALIYGHPEDQNPERSVTVNLSRNGCFLFSSQYREVGSDVWVRFRDFPDETPIQGLIRNRIPWGEFRRIPGIGVEFRKILPSQTQYLESLLQL